MAAESAIRLWAASNDYITLSYAWARVQLSKPGERITDRLGLVHRIAPAGDRYPVGLTLGLPAVELMERNCLAAPVRRTVLEWLEYYARKQAGLMVFVQGATLAVDGSELSRQLAFAAIIEDLPEHYFGTLVVGDGATDSVEFTMLVTEDGTFGNFDSLGSFNTYSPARP